MAGLCLTGISLVAAVAAGDRAWSQPATSESASLAAWAKISDVLQHPRCLNCHQPKTPLQGDRRRIHVPPVARGADSKGVGTMRCRNCHNDSDTSETPGVSGNNEWSGVPGAPNWQLAPVSMSWQGLSTGDLCRMLKDPARNGNRAPQQLVEHMETEDLVLWGWKPGAGRKPIPVAHKDFIDQMKAWVSGGTACPP